MSGVLQAATISSFIYGDAETKRALAQVYDLTETEICGIMRQVSASNN